jgi:hypothetical protein
MGEVKDEHGQRYEFTFNTWGYTWPERWGASPTKPSEPQRFGRNAYTGLYHFTEEGVHRGARRQGAHRRDGLWHRRRRSPRLLQRPPEGTYEAVDMQQAPSSLPPQVRARAGRAAQGHLQR